ncbi:MAG: helix-turn-helix domain-containing protein [Butyrivibrio sp.]|nr:helix-turn-helix domain-containing protein [Butyrivibrio sp.]
MIDFGNRLKKLRRKNNMSQSQLAERLGLTKSVVSAYENGIRMPSYEALIKIARVYRVSTDYLLGNENHENLDMSGLSDSEKVALKNLVRAMQEQAIEK